MKTKIIASCLVGCVLAGNSLGAQERPWTLQNCIDHALENNINVRRSEISVEQREIDLNNAENNRLPDLSAGTSQNFSFGRGLTADNTYANTNTTSTSFSLGSSLSLFQGFRVRNNIELSKLNLQAATADLEKVRDDIRVAVAQAYVQVLYNSEIASVAQRQVAIDEQQVARLESMVENGKASGAEVASQQATLAQSRLSAVQAENNYRMALLDLSQLLELESPEGFSIVAPSVEELEPSLLPDPEDIYAEAAEHKASVLAEKLRVAYAAKNIDLAKGSFLPSLSLSGGLGTNYYTSSGYSHANFGNQLKNNFSQYVSLSLNVPIFSRFNTRNSVRNARLSHDTQQLQLENTRKSLYKEIQQAYYNAVGAQSKLISSAEAARSAEEAFELMEAKYENGKASITEFNESKNRYLSAASNLLQARYENLYQTQLLEFYRSGELDID